MEKYDVIIIGTGPAGEKAAAKAAYFRRKVAIIEKAGLFGGAGVNTGTLPSKTLRETSLYLSGKYDKGLYGIDRDILQEASVEHFLYRKNIVVQTEAHAVQQNLINHGVTIFEGTASFEDSHHIKVKGKREEIIYGENILIATGSYPCHPENIPFDFKKVHDSDSILQITSFPHSIAILGAGIIGLEYATIFSTMGCKVHLINRSDRILTFIDKEITQELLKKMKEDQINLLFNKSMKSIKDTGKELHIELESGEKLIIDMFLYAAGRNGQIKDLALKKVGIEVDNRENIPVNSFYQTKVPHIYAVGDVIGFPALGSTAMDQGRIAVSHMFQIKDIENIAADLPYGIYTVPEISTVGLTKDQALEKGMDCEEGISKHSQLPRGQIMGATSGMLKLVFTKNDLIVRGVHIIGGLATELIHYGMLMVQSKRTLNDLIGSVYNFPSLHELYKYAAYDGLGNLAGYKLKK